MINFNQIDLKKNNILIIYYEAILRETVKELLTHSNYNVKTKTNRNADKISAYYNSQKKIEENLYRKIQNLRLYQNLKNDTVIFSKFDCEESLNIFLDVLQKIFKSQRNAKKRIIYDVDTVNLKINKDYYFYILFQLIDNALKFSKNYAKVLISGKKREDEYIIVIRDFGNGFNIEETYPISKQLKNKKNELELSIFICKNIITNFKGTFEIKTKKNEGTVITIILPLNKPSVD